MRRSGGGGAARLDAYTPSGSCEASEGVEVGEEAADILPKVDDQGGMSVGANGHASNLSGKGSIDCAVDMWMRGRGTEGGEKEKNDLAYVHKKQRRKGGIGGLNTTGRIGGKESN